MAAGAGKLFRVDVMRIPPRPSGFRLAPGSRWRVNDGVAGWAGVGEGETFANGPCARPDVGAGADLGRGLACVRPFDGPLRRCSGRGQGERIGGYALVWRVVGRAVRERPLRLGDGGRVHSPEGVGGRDVPPPLWIPATPGSRFRVNAGMTGFRGWAGSLAGAACVRRSRCGRDAGIKGEPRRSLEGLLRQAQDGVGTGSRRHRQVLPRGPSPFWCFGRGRRRVSGMNHGCA